MKLINGCDNGRFYKDAKEWAKDIKEDLEHEYKIYKRYTKELPPSDVNRFLEGYYISGYIKWFLENYFD